MLNEIKAIRALAEILVDEYCEFDMDADEMFEEIMRDPFTVPVLYSSFDTTDGSGNFRDHDLEVYFNLVTDTVTVIADGKPVGEYPLTLHDLTDYDFDDLYNTALSYVPYL